MLRVWSSWSGLGTKKQPGTWLEFGEISRLDFLFVSPQTLLETLEISCQ